MYHGEAVCVCVPGQTTCLEGTYVRKGQNDAVVNVGGEEYLYPISWIVRASQGCKHTTKLSGAVELANLEVCVCVPGHNECIEGILIRQGMNDAVVSVAGEETLFPKAWVRPRSEGCQVLTASSKPQKPAAKKKKPIK